MTVMEIKTLTQNDYNAMVHLWQRANLPIRIKGRDSRSSIASQMKSNPDFFLGAFRKHCLVGVVIVSSDGRKGWINHLAVDPDYRRQGIAKALVVEAESVLRKQGIQIFSALIMDSNEPSKSLFKKCGYSEHTEIIYFSKRDTREV